MRCGRITLMALAIAAMLLPVGMSAQNESGRRNINKTRFQQLGYWYDSSTARFQTRYPIIRSLPPVNSGMPWDILAAYVYMDSLARFDNTRLTERTLDGWRAMRTMNDTLRYMAKYLYKLVDYDPITFAQYIDEVGLKGHDRYSADLRYIASQVSSTLYDGLPESERRAGMVALLETEYALRVRVISIDSMPSGSTDPKARYFYRVTAEVRDTLKGRVFAPCPVFTSNTKKDDRSILASSEAPCIQFIYLNNLYFDPRNAPSGAPHLFSGRDPEFATGPDSSFVMKAGQEAVVFLQLTGWKVDSAYDYYHVRIVARTSFGALPIIGGQVRDVNHIWSDQTLLGYEEWKRNFMMLRERLLAGTY